MSYNVASIQPVPDAMKKLETYNDDNTMFKLNS